MQYVAFLAARPIAAAAAAESDWKTAQLYLL
jgi:hypothetical protein